MPACAESEVIMNENRPKGNQKHIDLSGRIRIEQGLNNGESFRTIARDLNKDPSTISKEVRRHSVIKERKPDAFAPIPCANNYDTSKPKANVCKILHGCGDNECTHKCVNCRKARCSEICNHYKPRQCEKLAKPPYACNGCPKKTNCMMDRKIYSSKYAQDTYETLRTTSREGINQTPESIQKLNDLLSPLIKKGQSIAHIYASHAEEIACSRRTIYSYIDSGVFEVRNMDLRRKVVYKPRKKKTATSTKDRAFRKDRGYKELGLKSSKDPFFYTTGGKKLTESSLAYAFKLIRSCINSNPTGYPYVRLYDFRHTFACNTILRWNEQGEDVNEKLYVLSTYLGHVKPADTFWYLSATPELLKALCSKYEEQFGGNDDEI